MKIGDTYFHITRYTYKKIKEDIPSMDPNSMWEREIYLSNVDNLIELKKYDNGTLYELLYEGYRLFFISEYQKEPYRNNVFWVNILKQGTVYDKYKNEEIITYKFGDFQKGKTVLLNGKMNVAVHTGNTFNRYCQIRGLNISNPESENKFWIDIKNSLINPNNNGLEFITSSFGKFMIVHGIKDF